MALMRRSLLVLVAAASFGLIHDARDARADEPRARAARAPIPLDGIAAVVDDVIVFRSEINQRASHFEDRLSKNPIERRAQLVALHKEIVEHLIDEILIGKDAAKLHLEVTDAEVADALASVAASNKIDRSKLEAEVIKQGYTLLEYREEIRRQLLLQKWLMIRASGKIDRKKATDQASFELAYAKQRELLILELRTRAFVEIR
jgi:parvulin-like peptidyl-prolyl isomerase